MNCPHNECRIRQTCTRPSACIDPARLAIGLARRIINEHAHAVTQEIAEQLATAVINGAHKRDSLRSTITMLTAERDALKLERDAAKAEARITRRAATTSEESERAWSDAVASWRHVAGDNAKSIERLTAERDAAREEVERLVGKISADDSAAAKAIAAFLTDEELTRLAELAERLTASGPKCCAVSASECHEIAEGVETSIAELRTNRTAALTAKRIPGDRVNLSLDEYEAANLQWGLRVLRRLGLDTGDWLGQILHQLDDDYGHPNMDEAFTDATITRLLEGGGK